MTDFAFMLLLTLQQVAWICGLLVYTGARPRLLSNSADSVIMGVEGAGGGWWGQVSRLIETFSELLTQ